MSRLRFTGILVMLLSSVVFTLLVGAQERVDVKGVVTGKDGSPKIRASIQLSGPKRYFAVTNAQGEFSLRGVETGDYAVNVIQGDKMQRFPIKITNDTLNLRVPW